MQLRDLELFVHLARTLNFGRTSLECHVSPATLTRTVQRLETEAGTRLLDRGPRGTVLTADGRRFLDWAGGALGSWAEFRAGTDGGAELTGELRLFATVTACQSLLPALLAPFREEHPHVRPVLRTGGAAAALARLDDGEVDAAVAGVPDRLPQSLVGRTLHTTDLVLVTARGKEEGALDGPFVVPDRGLVRDGADRWFRSRGATPEIVAEPDTHEALLALVVLGYGTGVVPRLVVRTSATADRLGVVEAGLGEFPVALCVRRDDMRRPLVAALWDAAGRAATELLSPPVPPPPAPAARRRPAGPPAAG
ncbi:MULTISPECIES: LysR substrate-binding domain-containing protein [unclassified Pseudonocardia]|uniref:LysR substrate-binding domain-containing protein n=1 Tax=unclassified Pseudonocardia TaxID=2619320 RepID=UPI0001FFDB29|nr:LysR substrate-binding domain-containing protein [Pseudonocardia sp. Ae707_Ps1]OLM16626.1 HTH-type transcriptional regulator IlvY [Pseudonocardia sp. Ae707_Ps1]